MTSVHLEGSSQHELIVQEALRQGLTVLESNEGLPIRRSILIGGKQREELLQGIPQSWVNEMATVVCDRKQETKELFGLLQVQTPKSIRFQELAELNPEIFTQKKEFVCKPEIGTNGKGVCFEINSWKVLEDYVNGDETPDGPYLLEEYVSGADLRIQVIGSRMVAACIRHPAYVLGDGQSTLVELIERRRMQIQAQNPANALIIDQQSLQLIEQAGHTMNSVITKGTKVKLKRVANMGQGAIAEDCTDLIDPRIDKWIDKLSASLNMPYFALDILTNDIRRIEAYYALEVNLRAEWMHHTFSEGRQHDLAAVIIRELFGNS